MLLLYTLAIRLYGLGIYLASFFSPKAKLWVDGRKDWAMKLAQFNEQFPHDPNRPRVWVHCASLGEFEQGRTLIEAIKEVSPKTVVILTFFSPSGYEIRKNYAQADGIFYLPLDTARNAQQFLALVQPSKVVFVKYEFWYHYLSHLKKAAIPTIVISAIFRPDQVFFRPYGGFFRRILGFFDHLFVQDQSSADLLRSINIYNTTRAGDTRIDRVAQIPSEGKAFPKIAAFLDDAPCLVVGSSWGPDEAILKESIDESLPKEWKIIIAPHDISSSHLDSIEKLWGAELTRFSTLKEQSGKRSRYLLIDNIGMLQALYQYGKIAYIGGGFGSGIHNTLEPITFGLPVIFGPKYQKFEEAKQLIQDGGGFTISNAEELSETLELLLEPSTYQNAANRARAYIENNQGGTEKILNYLAF